MRKTCRSPTKRSAEASSSRLAVHGHWEGDLIAGLSHSYIATLVERQSRFTILVKVDGKDSPTVVKATPSAVLAKKDRSLRPLTGGLESDRSATEPAASKDIRPSRPCRTLQGMCCVDCLSPRSLFGLSARGLFPNRVCPTRHPADLSSTCWWVRMSNHRTRGSCTDVPFSERSARELPSRSDGIDNEKGHDLGRYSTRAVL